MQSEFPTPMFLGLKSFHSELVRNTQQLQRQWNVLCFLLPTTQMSYISAMYSWSIRIEVANALMRAESQLVLGQCWSEKWQTAARAVTPQLVKWAQSLNHGYPSLTPVFHNQEHWPAQLRAASLSWPGVSFLLSGFSDEKWQGKPAQELRGSM